jgi:hypothetical protein
MFFAGLVVLALQGPTLPPAHLDARRAPVTALVDSLEAAELRFFYEWREVLKISVDGRHESSKVASNRATTELREGYSICAPGAQSRFRRRSCPVT